MNCNKQHIGPGYRNLKRNTGAPNKGLQRTALCAREIELF